jgi:hypothetical protein
MSRRMNVVGVLDISHRNAQALPDLRSSHVPGGQAQVEFCANRG